jgi:hypothetical protein
VCHDQATHAEKYAKYKARSDCALATIVLAVDTFLLYLIGDLEDPSCGLGSAHQAISKENGSGRTHCLSGKGYAP